MTGDQWFALSTVVLSVCLSGAISYTVAKFNHDRSVEREKAAHKRIMKKQYADKMQSIYEEYSDLVARMKIDSRLVDKTDMRQLTKLIGLIRLYSTDEIVKHAAVLLIDAVEAMGGNIGEEIEALREENTIIMQGLIKEHLRTLFSDLQ